MTPEETLKKTKRYLEELQKALTMSVKVGLPADKVGGKVYDDGMSIMQIGAIHEYGYPPIPQRSFLAVPFQIKAVEIGVFIGLEFNSVFKGTMTTERALARIGVKTSNISKEAFRTNGFGTWEPLSDAYMKIKEKAGKTNTLLWSGILRGSITYTVE